MGGSYSFAVSRALGGLRVVGSQQHENLSLGILYLSSWGLFGLQGRSCSDLGIPYGSRLRILGFLKLSWAHAYVPWSACGVRMSGLSKYA